MSGVPVRSPLSPTMRARFKAAVRAAVDRCGNISGAAATCERKDQSVGEWNSRSTEAFPPVDCAFAMDEVAVAKGERPEVLTRYASELGFVCIRLPEALAGDDAVTMAMIEASAEFGDVAAALRDATADGRRDGEEDAEIVRQIDEAFAALARMRALLVAPAAVRVPVRERERAHG